MTKPYEEKKIKLSLLDLDTNNPRFLMLYKDSKNEEDIIKYLLNNENAIDLVKSITSHNDYFPDSFCYVLEKNGRYIVKEGNRRIAALKALEKPKKYLNSKYTQFNIEEVPCLLYRDENKLSARIITRHTQIEVQRWSRLAQGAYIQTYLDNGGKLSEFSYLKDYKNVYKLFKLWEAGNKFEGYGANLIDLLITWERASIIERFFGRSDLLKKMGFEFKDNGALSILEDDVFQKSLDCFLEWLKPTNKDITAKKINKNTIDGYFNDVFSKNGYKNPQLSLIEEPKNEESPNPSQTIEKHVSGENAVNTTSEEIPMSNEKSSPNDVNDNSLDICEQNIENNSDYNYEESVKKSFKERKTLIPKSLANIIPNQYTKTCNLFNELQNIDILKNPTCCALGFRAFIEYSCKIYMEKVNGKDINKNEESNLSGNICSIAGTLMQKSIITKGLSQYINRRYKDKICPLNDIVHGYNYPINSTQLCMDWDAYQNLFIPMWVEINNLSDKG